MNEMIIYHLHAGMAELADAHGSGPCGSNTMRVQVPFPAFFILLEKFSCEERCVLLGGTFFVV